MITSIIKCGMKLLIHSQNSTVQQLKFGNGSVISSHTLLSMWLSIRAGIKDAPCVLVKGAPGEPFTHMDWLWSQHGKLIISIISVRWNYLWAVETSIHALHYDVVTLKHLRRFWPFVKGIHRWQVDSPRLGSVARSFGVIFWCTHGQTVALLVICDTMTVMRRHYNEFQIMFVTEWCYGCPFSNELQR